MRTEVERSFKWGFVLSEEELRRVFQTCLEHSRKVNPNDISRKVCAKCRDGSLVESDALEDILALENAGSKSVQRLTLEFSDSSEESPWLIRVLFNNGYRDTETWTAVAIRVVGESRDWAFVAGADLEERVKKTRVVSWPRLVAARQSIPIIMSIMLLAMFVPWAIGIVHIGEPDVAAALEEQHKAGKISDPIEAMIMAHRYKQENTLGPALIFLPMMAGPVIVMIAYAIAAYAMPRVCPSYIFYWGDSVRIYDKRRTVMRVFWGVLVLGVLASLIAGIILRFV